MNIQEGDGLRCGEFGAARAPLPSRILDVDREALDFKLSIFALLPLDGTPIPPEVYELDRAAARYSRLQRLSRQGLADRA